MINNSNLYFKKLLAFLKEKENLNYSQQNDLWLEKYRILEQSIEAQSLDMLPEIMTLIYPQFLINGNGEIINSDFNSTSFNKNISSADSCQYSVIEPNGICEFNDYRIIRGKCQADHFWPSSLGGPSLGGNRILLCQFHNVSKSNSIMYSFWNNYPNWLNSYLEDIYNRKK